MNTPQPIRSAAADRLSFSCAGCYSRSRLRRLIVAVGESISKYRFAQATAKTGITFFNLREAGLMPHCASWVGFSQRPFAGWSLFLPPYQMTKKKSYC